MAHIVVKNRNTKISPGGLLTLPLSARKALQMEPGKGCRVSIAMAADGVSITPTSNQAGTRVSPRGQMELVGEPRAMLSKAEARHYWLEANDEKRLVILHPYTK